MAATGASSQQASSQPSADVNPRNPEWMVAQQERLDAARQVFGGHANVSLEKAYPLMYLQGAKEAIDTAGKMVAEGRSSQPAQSSQLGQSSASASSQPSADLVRQASDADSPIRNHYDANLFQNRFGETSPTMFNPARHTVVIAGRPVQATWDGNLVMSPQPCADSQSFNYLIHVLIVSPGSLDASRVYPCPSTLKSQTSVCKHATFSTAGASRTIRSISQSGEI